MSHFSQYAKSTSPFTTVSKDRGQQTAAVLDKSFSSVSPDRVHRDPTENPCGLSGRKLGGSKVVNCLGVPGGWWGGLSAFVLLEGVKPLK